MDYILFLSSILLFCFSMCFSPGPNNTLGMAIGLDKGFKAALPLCFGGGIGGGFTLILSGLGLGEFFERIPELYTILRYVGAVYICWLAYKVSGLMVVERLWARLRGEKGSHGGKYADINDKLEARRKQGITPLTFPQAVTVQLVNVKVWITNILIVTNYVGTGDDRWIRLGLVTLLVVVLGSSAICLWSASGVFLRRFLTSEGMRRCNYLFAISLLCSVALLFV